MYAKAGCLSLCLHCNKRLIITGIVSTVVVKWQRRRERAFILLKYWVYRHFTVHILFVTIE